MSLLRSPSTVLVALAVTAGPLAAQAQVHPLLAERMAAAAPDERVEAYLVMDDHLGLGELEELTVGLAPRERRGVVAAALKQHAAQSQADVRALLGAAEAAGRATVDEVLWIGNAIAFTAEADVIEQLAALDGVHRIRPVLNPALEELHDAVDTADASYPFFEDFESGAIDTGVWTLATTGTGVVDVTSDHGPEGSFHVTMASSIDNSESTASMTLSLDLTGQSNVGLRFKHKEFGDEDDPEDAVFVSDDGGANWFSVLSLTGGGSTYSTKTLELDAAVATLGLSYTSDFRIRFSWSDNYALTTDGFAFDDIEIAPGVGEPVPELNIVKLQAPQLWEAGVTGAGMLIANIDSGTDTDHPSLVGALWNNPGEIPGNGVDDDGNGKIDDVVGWDFLNNNNDPNSGSSHGTQTAGLMVGDGTNGPITGMAPGATLVPMEVGGEVDYWAAQQYALDIGVDVISSSFSFKWPFSPKPDYALHRTICDAELAAGIIHANSIGNQGNITTTYPIPFNVSAPGNCPQPWGHPDAEAGGRSSVLGCAGLQLDDTLYTSSGQGPVAWEDVTLYDPGYPHGQDPAYFDYPYGGFGGGQPGLIKPDVATYTNTVQTTTIGGGFSSFSGTSAATPQLGGGLALLRSAQPAALPRHIAAAVELTAEDLGPAGKDNRYGAGKLQVFDAARRLRVLGTAADTTPAIGTSTTIDVVGPANATVFVVYSGTLVDGPGDLDLGAPFFLLTTVPTDGAGAGSLPVSIPSAPSLVDLPVHFQFGTKIDDPTTWGPGPLLSVPETILITN